MYYPKAYKFSSATYNAKIRGIGPNFTITTKIVHHSGENLGWGTQVFHIEKFEGSKKIQTLPIYPLQFHPDPDRIRRHLIQRGREYLSLTEKPTCREYRDFAIKAGGNNARSRARGGRPSMGKESELEERFDSTGRIIVDPVAFSRYDSNSPLLDPMYTVKIDRKQLADDDIMFCNHRVLGFSFRAKEWGAFAVNQITNVIWNDTAFDRLILDEKKQRMISNLVTAHQVDSAGPGVGKTLTAEAVAEMTQRPLYVVSAGELGTNIITTDDRLSMALEMARRWGCVLLIDEADVFLHKRNIGNLERNALVSLFLRRLEYFEGIMILTTNRDKDMDEAFTSAWPHAFQVQLPFVGRNKPIQVVERFSESSAERDHLAVSEETRNVAGQRLL
ncbi:AAA family ATPase [Seiridium cupressi]